MNTICNKLIIDRKQKRIAISTSLDLTLASHPELVSGSQHFYQFKKIALFIFLFLFTVLHFSFAAKLKTGTYRGVLLLDSLNNIELPFNFDVIKKGKKLQLIIRNAEEKIIVDELQQKGDSVFFKMPVFDTEFRTKLVNDNLEGVWINHYRKEKNTIKFKAEYNNPNRFPFVPGKENPYFEGRWETTFSPGSKDSSKAIAVFHHIEQTDYLSGTFLTETGDYRFLEGIKKGNELYLSCFDGSHAFLFTAQFKDDHFEGVFYSGAHWKENWAAKKNDAFKLRNADEITFLKSKDAKLEFSFLNLEGKKIALSDKKFENKAVIVQVMGSWCPNCMDESAYLAGVYKKYQPQGLEIIALAFEKTTDMERAKKQLTRLKNRFDMQYEILITQLTGKDKASETLSALNKISAFPTTLFLNKKHEVVKVHTGFSGPATGKDYETFKQNTEKLIDQLIKE